MKTIKRTLILILVFSLAMAVSAVAAVNIGVVDVETIIRDSEAGRAARAEMEGQIAARRKLFQEKEATVRSLEARIRKEAKGPSTGEKREELRKQVRELKRLRADLGEELKQMDKKLAARLLKEIIGVARKIGKAEGYTLIVERGPPLIYADDAVDITGKVIEEYNRLRKKK